MTVRLITQKARIVFCAFALLVDFGPQVCAAGEQDDIGAELDRRIAAWYKDWHENYSLSPFPTRSKYFDDIVELGLPAVPYMMERMQRGSMFMSVAIRRITGKQFAEDERPEKWRGGVRDNGRMLVKWWPKARKETPKRFKRLYSEWKELENKGESLEAQKKRREIEHLGVAALPLIMERVEAGDIGLIPMAQKITKGKTKGKSQSECTDWWEKNRDQWQIPFPNAQPTAKAGEDRTAVIGDVVTLDASASTDADGDELFFRWKQVAGPSVTLSDAKGKQPTFVAPTVEKTTILTFELVVDDAGDLTKAVPTPKSKSKPARVTITVEPK